MALRYAISGDLRFLSHLDTLRLFERALARAAAPVRFSEGFNPRPKMMIPLPRSVGIESADEMLVVELVGSAECAEFASRLSPHLPAGLNILSAEVVPDGDRRLPIEVRYALALSAEQRAVVSTARDRVLSSESIDVERRSPKAPARVVDIRPFIESIDLDGDGVTWTQRITPKGTARPSEVLEALGLPAPEHIHRLRRVQVRYMP